MALPPGPPREQSASVFTSKMGRKSGCIPGRSGRVWCVGVEAAGKKFVSQVNSALPPPNPLRCLERSFKASARELVNGPTAPVLRSAPRWPARCPFSGPASSTPRSATSAESASPARNAWGPWPPASSLGSPRQLRAAEQLRRAPFYQTSKQADYCPPYLKPKQK